MRILKSQNFKTLLHGHLLVEGQELLWSQQTVSEPYKNLSGNINVFTTAFKAEPVDIQREDVSSLGSGQDSGSDHL